MGGSGRAGHKPFVSEVDATVHNIDCATFALVYRLDTPQAQSFLGQFVDLDDDEHDGRHDGSRDGDHRRRCEHAD